MAGFTGNKPKAANQILLDLQEIEDNFEFLKAVIEMLSGGWSDSATTHLMAGNAGDFNRSKIVSASDTTITLTAAKYHHAGTTDQVVYWADTTTGITFTVGSGGSNGLSDDLGASEWHYIYLDDSAIVTAGTNIISNTELLNDTTGPTWNGAKYGWYNGSDRCIGAFYSDADSDILEFLHDGGDYVLFADRVVELAATDIDTSWTDIDMASSVPSFSIKVNITLTMQAGGSATKLTGYWRTNGQTGGTAHRFGYADDDNAETTINDVIVITDSSQIIEVKTSGSTGHTIQAEVNGWHFPQGM